jgi:hypothetical protein
MTPIRGSEVGSTSNLRTAELSTLVRAGQTISGEGFALLLVRCTRPKKSVRRAMVGPMRFNPRCKGGVSKLSVRPFPARLAVMDLPVGSRSWIDRVGVHRPCASRSTRRVSPLCTPRVKKLRVNCMEFPTGHQTAARATTATKPTATPIIISSRITKTQPTAVRLRATRMVEMPRRVNTMPQRWPSTSNR